MVSISYAITVCNEFEEIIKLLILMFKLKRIFSILLVFLLILSCSSSNDKPLVPPPKEKISLPKLWGFAMDDFNNGNAEGAIEKFKMVEKDYSYTEWAPKSLLMMAYVYYEANRCSDTLSILERYVKFYPSNPERVYVEYLKGVCYFEEVSEFSKDQEKTVKAINQFKSLINNYPNTEYAEDAKYKLDLLNDLGVSEMELLTILDDSELYPDEQLEAIASRLGFGEQFNQVIESN